MGLFNIYGTSCDYYRLFSLLYIEVLISAWCSESLWSSCLTYHAVCTTTKLPWLDFLVICWLPEIISTLLYADVTTVVVLHVIICFLAADAEEDVINSAKSAHVSTDTSA